MQHARSLSSVFERDTGGGRGANTHQTHEMTVPNEIIGCVIGKGGSKIAEIRCIFLLLRQALAS